MTIQGLHHITIVCADAQRTVDFYTGVLGFRLIKKTVNFDDPGSYHLYFGNNAGSPGSVITFFEWPRAPKGHWGVGGTHHYAMQVGDYSGLLKWKRRLNDLSISVDGPLDRHYFTSIYFNDPDGTILEIATLGPGWTIDEAPDCIGREYREPPADMMVRNRDDARISATTWAEPVPEITADMALNKKDACLHHITAIGSDIRRTSDFFAGLLGMRRVKMTSNFDDPDSPHWYWGVGEGRPGTLVTYFGRNPSKERRVTQGTGQTHHFALVVPDEDALAVWRETLVAAGLEVTPIRDRIYFKSIYMHDPDGHIVELATAGPGFAVDEDRGRLGSDLKLPPWLEGRREDIEAKLRPLHGPDWRSAEVAS
ncbi:MAG: VOC family protein [Chloroflexota bacterium]|nr:VOC family protein [Chloroflexota bacterium]